MTIVHEDSKQHKVSVIKRTQSTHIQKETELECQPYYADLPSMPTSQLEELRRMGLVADDSFEVKLLKDKHIAYLEQIWKDGEMLRSSFTSLDASRPWMCYWTLHACDLMGHSPNEGERRGLLDTILSSWGKDISAGYGFGGGPGQLPHAATTYAAIMTMCILATGEDDVSALALKSLAEKRSDLTIWLQTLIQLDGSVRMHDNGELDVRASYCVLAVARLLNLKLNESRMAEHLIRCQTFEGGFGGEPWTEAHGGYTFCAVAALHMLGSLHDADVNGLMSWLARMQCGYEGGFCGRTSKLVDGCYSFWQGGAVSIVSNHIAGSTEDPWLEVAVSAHKNELLLDQGMLQRYILLCAQNITGGLRDKPSARRDFYHSCYNLSGLSVSQTVKEFGHEQTTVNPTHPCFNIRTDRARRILEYFEKCEE